MCRIAELESNRATLAAEQRIQIAINELVALAPRLDKRAMDALSVNVVHLYKLINNEQERLFDEDYLMDSKECIHVIREEVKRWNDSRAPGIKEESE
ncbi:TPA: hypothetical protein PRU61_003209 [Escherichia coli]|nr:hypothetical protein [Escherichia coli]HDK0786093.1 hypothetical protein [Escherichia coli]HDK0790968.1 hypothetical protein [Escherichia coli]